MLRFIALIFFSCLSLGALCLQFALAALSVIGAGAAFTTFLAAKGVQTIYRKFKGA